jgi:hypothetical protein
VEHPRAELEHHVVRVGLSLRAQPGRQPPVRKVRRVGSRLDRRHVDALAVDRPLGDDVAAVKETGAGLLGAVGERDIRAVPLEEQRLGEHHGEDLAHEADLASGQERAEHRLGDTRERHAEHSEVDVGGGQHLDARPRGRLRRIDLHDPGMRPVRAHERGVQRSRQLEIVDILPRAGDEARVLAPTDALADHPRRIPERIQVTNTAWKGSLAHSETAPPGTAG